MKTADFKTNAAFSYCGVAVLISIMASFSGQSADAEKSKELCFSFNEENVFTVEKAGGTARWVRDGKDGGAYQFDGGEEGIEIKDDPRLRFGPHESFSMELWVKPLANDPTKRQVVLSKSDPASKNYWNFHLYTAGRLGFRSGSSNGLNINMLSPDNSVGDWHHVAFVRDSQEGMIRFYLDNKMIAEKDFPAESGQFDASGPLVIGKSFEGLIDEIKISPEVKRDFKMEADGQVVAAAAEYRPGKAVTETPDKDVAASWDEIDKQGLAIIPCPKRFKVIGDPIPLDGKWEIIAKSPGAGTGIEELNNTLAGLGRDPLGVVKDSTANRVVIGNFDDMADYLPRIGNPSKPPRQGYVIDFYKDGASGVCVVAGADTDGTRYGCFTLAGMTRRGQRVELVQAKVLDWPDYKYRMGSGIHDAGLERLKQTLDMASRMKMNMIPGDGFYSFIDDLMKTTEQRKKVYAYAASRGMTVVLGGNWDVGRAPRSPDDLKTYTQYYYPYKSEEGVIGCKGHAYTWSRDDLIDGKGDMIKEFMNKTGAEAFFLHAMDTGGRDNPENWANRTPMDVKRWGNDRAAADANFINRIYEKMRQGSPKAMICTIIYPYGASYLKYPEVQEWLGKLSSLVPEDLFICVREDARENMEKWKNATRQGRFVYHEPNPCSFGLMCPPTGRYARTFYFDDKDIYWFCLGGLSQWPAVMMAAEYAWNTQAPGWGWMQADYRTIPGTDAFPPELSEKLLPRITRHLFGEKAAENMRKVYAMNLPVTLAGDLHHFCGTDPEGYFKAKYSSADEAMKWMREIEKDIPKASLPVFNATKGGVKYARYLLEARYRYFLARKMLAQERYDDATGEVELARKALGELDKDDRHVKAVMADLDIASAIKWRRERNELLKKPLTKNISVGLYSLGLFKGVGESLGGVKGLTVSTFDDPTEKTLQKYDVIMFPAANDIGDTTEDWRENVRQFVVRGGGVVFSHNSIGRVASSAFGKPLFPEICGGYAGQMEQESNFVIEEDHPCAGELRKGERIEREYTDHLYLKPGEKSRIILKDSAGNAVMTVGQSGKGRVVYTGEIFGMNRRDEQKESVGREWILLYSMIRWAVGLE